MGTGLKVAVVNCLDTRDVRVLSGASHFMIRALERHGADVTQLGPLPSRWMQVARYLHGAAKVMGRAYDWHHNLLASRAFGRNFAQRLGGGNYDVIFAPLASTEIAFLETEVPIVYLTDMTVASGKSYYGALTNLLPLTEREGATIEKKATERAAAIVAPSDWAIRSFEKDYGYDSARLHVVSYGANLDDPPTRDEALAERDTRTCRLLLLGVDWERKGGPLALATLKALLEGGIDAELLVCGCEPPAGVNHPSMRVLPFLRKDNPAQALELRRLLLTSTFLIVPSKAEAWGFVFGEASACGLPSVTRDTGGVSSVVRDEVNGLLLPADAEAAAYASRIRKVLEQPGRYRELCISSRDEYETRLNWDRWASRMLEIFAAVKAEGLSAAR
jgi:glycosyltransferase involved in cell wall biosynthesis